MHDPQKFLIMVIDPDPLTWTSLAPVLETEGFRATSCSAIGNALSAIRRRDPDLVIVGKERENCEGMILVGRIKTMFPDMKVILQVESGDWPSRLDAMDAGADEIHERKYSGTEGLMEGIRRLLLDPVHSQDVRKTLVTGAP